MRNLIGQTLDHYKILDLLGEGGMGAVFKARDVTLQRDVAIKVMHPHIARQSNFKERFLQEARSTAKLDHPGIVQVYDFGLQRSLLYIVMKFIPGANLRHMLQDLKAQGKWVPLDEAVQLVSQVCLALDHAHRKGVLHRDIKPSNVMIEPEPSDGLPYHPILTDLGLAKLVAGQPITREGTSMGTPAYMSPEQALGQPTDARSDVYSLGVLLYELAVGRAPFPAKTITEAIHYHTKETPPAPRSVRLNLPEPLEHVILKALEKDPGDRFSDAAALAQALEDVLPAVTKVAATPTALESAVSLMTQYQHSLVEPRGPSILEEFETPSDLSRDRIQILARDRTTRSVAIKAGGMAIGREDDSDIVLDDPKVSRQHARVEFDGTNYRVVDLDSTNGTFLANAKLLPGVPEVWTPEVALHIGDTWLRLARARQPASGAIFRSDGTMIDRSQILTSSGEGRVGVFMETAQLTVEPGSSTVASIVLLNQGAVVDHFKVSVAGISSSWLPSLPPVVELMPGDQREVTLTIQPPRSSRSRAGRYPITVQVTSQDAPDQVAELKATLTLAAYSQFSSELHPQKLRAGQSGRVTVENRGNTQETFAVEWQDRGDELAFEPPQAQLTVLEGQETAVEFRATPRRRRWIGGAQTHPFTAQVSLAKGKPQTHSGEVVSKGLIPAWVPPLIAVPLIALCLFLVYLMMRPPVIHSVTLDPPHPEPGQAVTVSWNIDRAQSIELRPLGIVLDPGRGGYTFREGFPVPTDLTVVASNRFGSDEESLPIEVVEPTPTPTPEPGTPIVELYVFPTEITPGESVTIRWEVENAESVTLEPFGTVDLTGEREDKPQQTRMYSLIATNQGKTAKTSQEVVVVTPIPDAPVVKEFTADPETVIVGLVETIHLTWDTAKADTVTIEPGVGGVGLAGSRDVPAPEADTIYTLVAQGPGGETRREVQVTVEEPLCTVATEQLNLRSGPGTVYEPPIRAMVRNTELKPLTFYPSGYPEPQWIEVEVQGTGEKGWVRWKEPYVHCNIDPPTQLPPPSAVPLTPVPFAVTVTARVEPSSFTGDCPKTFGFRAEIVANGPGTAQYRWEWSDGSVGSVESVTFAAAGEETVYTSRAFGTEGSHWGQVRILQPNELVSNKGELSLTCPPPLPVGNLLSNPDAQSSEHWVAYGDAAIEQDFCATPCFVVRNKGHFHQDVLISEDEGYLLMIGCVSSERINPDGAITGLPYLYGYMMGSDGKIIEYLQGQQMRCSANVVDEWVIAWGIFEIAPSTKTIRFFLNQAERAGVPQNGSAARFDNLGLYILETESEAREFVDDYAEICSALN